MRNPQTIYLLGLGLLGVLGGSPRNDPDPEGPQADPDRSPRSSKGSEEVDRPDLEIEIDGKRIMIDLNWFEWIIIGTMLIVISLVYRSQA